MISRCFEYIKRASKGQVRPIGVTLANKHDYAGLSTVLSVLIRLSLIWTEMKLYNMLVWISYRNSDYLLNIYFDGILFFFYEDLWYDMRKLKGELLYARIFIIFVLLLLLVAGVISQYIVVKQQSVASRFDVIVKLGDSGIHMRAPLKYR